MAEQIGVYICECGPNIKDAMNIDDVADFAQQLDGVIFARIFRLLCSQEGKELIAKDVHEQGLTRVVIAACSPKEHEHTFRKVISDAGLNPYMLQIVNIREQCAWVIKDKGRATDLAKSMIKAAVYRVAHHAALETKEIEAQPDVLVVGAGITGMSAALTLAQKQRKVYLVERSPCLGGKVVRYEEVFPNLECAPCMLEPALDEVLHHERIEVLTLSEINEVLGFYGNFIVKVNKKSRLVDMQACIGCRACIEPCPVEVSDEYNESLAKRKAIYFPFAGALPNAPAIDKEHCLRFKSQECDLCQKACQFAAINYEETDQVRELNVGAIVVATGFDLFDVKNASQFGYGKIENVYTSLEFERLLSSTGHTGGEILKKDGQVPEKVALIHCVGSRSKKFHEHCSGVCCSYLVKFAHLLKQKFPEVSIVDIYSDFCLPGKQTQKSFNDFSKEQGVEFVRVNDTNDLVISEVDGKISVKYPVSGAQDDKSLEKITAGLRDLSVDMVVRLNDTNDLAINEVDGKISLKYAGSGAQDDKSLEKGTAGLRDLSVDMVVLAPAIVGAVDAQVLAQMLDLTTDENGFFNEEHSKLSPVSTTTEGIFIVGCAQGPQDIAGSVAQGQAAAGKILSRLVPGEKLTLDPCTAEVDEDLCSGCKTCIGVCIYNAVCYDEEKKRAAVNEALCRGCGVCVATCPSAAITGKHFTDEQILQEVKGVLED